MAQLQDVLEAFKSIGRTNVDQEGLNWTLGLDKDLGALKDLFGSIARDTTSNASANAAAIDPGYKPPEPANVQTTYAPALADITSHNFGTIYQPQDIPEDYTPEANPLPAATVYDPPPVATTSAPPIATTQPPVVTTQPPVDPFQYLSSLEAPLTAREQQDMINRSMNEVASGGMYIYSDPTQAHGQPSTPEDRADFTSAIDKYNNMSLTPDNRWTQMLLGLNNYFDQGQAAPGKLTPALADSAFSQWNTDSADSGWQNFMEKAIPIGGAIVTAGGLGAFGDVGAGGASGAGGMAAGGGTAYTGSSIVDASINSLISSLSSPAKLAWSTLENTAKNALVQGALTGKVDLESALTSGALNTGMGVLNSATGAGLRGLNADLGDAGLPASAIGPTATGLTNLLVTGDPTSAVLAGAGQYAGTEAGKLAKTALQNAGVTGGALDQALFDIGAGKNTLSNALVEATRLGTNALVKSGGDPNKLLGALTQTALTTGWNSVSDATGLTDLYSTAKNYADEKGQDLKTWFKDKIKSGEVTPEAATKITTTGGENGYYTSDGSFVPFSGAATADTTMLGTATGDSNLQNTGLTMGGTGVNAQSDWLIGATSDGRKIMRNPTTGEVLVGGVSSFDDPSIADLLHGSDIEQGSFDGTELSGGTGGGQGGGTGGSAIDTAANQLTVAEYVDADGVSHGTALDGTEMVLMPGENSEWVPADGVGRVTVTGTDTNTIPDLVDLGNKVADAGRVTVVGTTTPIPDTLTTTTKIPVVEVIGTPDGTDVTPGSDGGTDSAGVPTTPVPTTPVPTTTVAPTTTTTKIPVVEVVGTTTPIPDVETTPPPTTVRPTFAPTTTSRPPRPGGGAPVVTTTQAPGKNNPIYQQDEKKNQMQLGDEEDEKLTPEEIKLKNKLLSNPQYGPMIANMDKTSKTPNKRFKQLAGVFRALV